QGGATISNGLTVQGGARIDNLNVTGPARIGGPLTVDGPSTFNNDVSIKGALSTTGPVTLKGLANNDNFAVDRYQSGQRRLLTIDGSGNTGTSRVTVPQVETTITRTVPRLEDSVYQLGKAVETTGAMAAAFSAVPEVTLQKDEPVRCGFGAGGFGSRYALAAGCAVRVAERLYLNGALSYAPSVDYGYGSTPSVGGRLGFSFPLGRIDKSAEPQSEEGAEGSEETDSTTSQEIQKDLIAMKSEISEREKEIEALKQQLVALTSQAGGGKNAELVALLQKRIEELEAEKRRSDSEDQRQNGLIQALQRQLAAQQARFNEMMIQIRALTPGGGNITPVVNPVVDQDTNASR
ncbi:YadA-like family protein, partial [Aphanothece stagnina]